MMITLIVAVSIITTIVSVVSLLIKCNELRDLYNDIKSRDKLHEDIDGLQQNKDALESELGELNTKKDDLTKVVSDLNTQSSELNREIIVRKIILKPGEQIKLEKNVDSLINSQNTLAKNIEELLVQKSSIEEAINKVISGIGYIPESREHLVELDKKISSTETNVNTLTSLVAKLKADVDKKYDKYLYAKDGAATTRAKNNYNAAKLELGDSETKLCKSRHELRELIKARKELDRIYTIIHILEQGTSERDLEEKAKQLKILERDKEKLIEQVTYIKEEYDQYSREVSKAEQAESRLRAAEKKMSELNQKKYDMTQKFTSLVAKSQELILLNLLLEGNIDSRDLIKEAYPTDICTSSSEWKERYSAQVAITKKLAKNKEAYTVVKRVEFNRWTEDNNKILEGAANTMLLAFDTICERACNYVTASNLEVQRKKVIAQFVKLNGQNQGLGIAISDKYLQSRIAELDLLNKYKIYKAEDKERERELKAQAAEERREQARLDAEAAEIQRKYEEQKLLDEKVQQELEKAKLEMEAQIQRLKDKFNSELEQHSDEERKKIEALEKQLQEREDELEQKRREQEEAERLAAAELAELEEKKEVLQAGFVYVISNEGAFGKDIYKIGVTRREDPLDRVNELSGASVPFKFNVHTIIPSEQAFKLEHNLHSALRKYRVNLINQRKEFFKVDSNELQEIIKQFVPEFEFIENIQEEQYHKSCEIRKNPEEFKKWLESADESSSRSLDSIRMLGIVKADTLESKDKLICTEEYTEYFEKFKDVLDADCGCTPVMKITKYTVGYYLVKGDYAKKVLTIYKSGDGGKVWGVNILNYIGPETSGSRNSIDIYKFTMDGYREQILSAVAQVNKELLTYVQED